MSWAHSYIKPVCLAHSWTPLHSTWMFSFRVNVDFAALCDRLLVCLSSLGEERRRGHRGGSTKAWFCSCQNSIWGKKKVKKEKNKKVVGVQRCHWLWCFVLCGGKGSTRAGREDWGGHHGRLPSRRHLRTGILNPNQGGREMSGYVYVHVIAWMWNTPKRCKAPSLSIFNHYFVRGIPNILGLTQCVTVILMTRLCLPKPALTNKLTLD